MGSSINIQVTGFVGNDPQVKQVGEQAVTSFSVAVSRKNALPDLKQVLGRLRFPLFCCSVNGVDHSLPYVIKSRLSSTTK